MSDRRPAVAGMFYESDPHRLRAQVRACFDANDPAPAKMQWIGAITPHAGLMYSGHVAAALFARLDVPERLIILSPNHTGRGHDAAINRDGSWLMPFGPVTIDTALADALIAECPRLAVDELAHQREHSLEVQLPFIQTVAPSARMVPICLARPSYEFCKSIGEAIATVVSRERERGERIGIVASSDMNHYEPQTTTLQKDQRAIDRVLALDPQGLWETVRGEDISMCGIIPATAMLVAATLLGATNATLVKHATSGDINGDYDAVVGYAAMVVS
ncbi:MAG: AmmeMemoRadiSam system protein B [Thermoanaerobaculia bacterium]